MRDSAERATGDRTGAGGVSAGAFGKLSAAIKIPGPLVDEAQENRHVDELLRCSGHWPNGCAPLAQQSSFAWARSAPGADINSADEIVAACSSASVSAKTHV